MNAALLTEIIAGVPIVAAAVVSIIVAVKANNKANTAKALVNNAQTQVTKMGLQLSSHIRVDHS